MEPGAVIGGKYRLVRKVGKGGMGTVWAATEIFHDAPCAVKLLSAEAAASDEMRTRLVREAGAAGRIKHPNVVDFHEVGVTDEGEPFLVMELLQGQTLRQLIRERGKLEPAVALWIGCEVARALAAAHKAGIAHRDLKPSNVFLHRDSSGHLVVKVLDFGVSKFLAEEYAQMTSTGAAIGSPAYMSPEQAKGDRVDHRTDIWSLGILVFEMLAGQRPFIADAPVAMLSLILFGRIPRVNEFAPEVDPVVDAIIARCLERRTEARYQQIDQVLDAFETRRAAMVEAETTERAVLDSWVDQPTTIEPLEAPSAQSWSTSEGAQSTSQSASVNASSQSASTAGMSASLPIAVPVTDMPFPQAEPKPTVPLMALIIPGIAIAGFFAAVVVLLIRYSSRSPEEEATPAAPPVTAPAPQLPVIAPVPTPPSTTTAGSPTVIPIPSSAEPAKADAGAKATAVAPRPRPIAAPKPAPVADETDEAPAPKSKPSPQPKKACASPIVDSDGKVVGCLD